MDEKKACFHCGESLEHVTFFVHPQLKKDLEWLVENRRAVAGEPNIDVVLERLIRLEVDKRQRIEVQKRKNGKG